MREGKVLKIFLAKPTRKGDLPVRINCSLCPFSVCPLIIRPGLVNSLNSLGLLWKGASDSANCTSCSTLHRPALFRLQPFIWPARFSCSYPCNSLDIAFCFCFLEASIWIVHFHPWVSHSTWKTYHRLWKCHLLKCFLGEYYISIIVQKIPRNDSIFHQILDEFPGMECVFPGFPRDLESYNGRKH